MFPKLRKETVKPNLPVHSHAFKSLISVTSRGSSKGQDPRRLMRYSKNQPSFPRGTYSISEVKTPSKTTGNSMGGRLGSSGWGWTCHKPSAGKGEQRTTS